MTLNKNQKIATIMYCLGVIVILFALTPWYEYHDDPIKFGTIFILPRHRIYFQLLYIELTTWSIFYLLSLMVLKIGKKE
jgi:hypothetical protein